jgi:hypothetical protein
MKKQSVAQCHTNALYAMGVAAFQADFILAGPANTHNQTFRQSNVNPVSARE